jgi:hypothetical protein
MMNVPPIIAFLLVIGYMIVKGFREKDAEKVKASQPRRTARRSRNDDVVPGMHSTSPQGRTPEPSTILGGKADPIWPPN